MHIVCYVHIVEWFVKFYLKKIVKKNEKKKKNDTKKRPKRRRKVSCVNKKQKAKNKNSKNLN